MNNVQAGPELVVRARAQQAGLDPVLDLLTRHAITVSARSLYYERDRTVLLLISDHSARAQSLLQAAGYDCRLDDVLWIRFPHYQPGSVARLCHELLHAGISIHRTYVSTLNNAGCCVVIKTSNNPAALRLLATLPVEHAA